MQTTTKKSYLFDYNMVIVQKALFIFLNIVNFNKNYFFIEHMFDKSLLACYNRTNVR